MGGEGKIKQHMDIPLVNTSLRPNDDYSVHSMDLETFRAVCQYLREELSRARQDEQQMEPERASTESSSIAPFTCTSGTTNILLIMQKAFPSLSPLALEGIYHRVIQIDGRRCIWEYDRQGKTPIEVWTEWEALWKRSLGEPEEGQLAILGNETETVEEKSRIGQVGDNNMLIVKMARAYNDVSPCYLARQIVRGYVEAFNETAKREWQAKKVSPRPDVGEEATLQVDTNDGQVITVQPTKAVPPSSHLHVYPKKLSHVRLYREPSTIPHQGLAANVTICHRLDIHCSPAMDEYRTAIGRQYEERLEAALTALGIPFLNEPAMRRLKYARTPDTILLEPIAIDGLSIKWIESKAWFGDPTAHASYLRDQYWPYYNRFGPGLVIYWFGYVREAMEVHRHQGILVMDAFPPSAKGNLVGEIARITRIHSPLTDLVLSCRPEAADADSKGG